MFVQPPGRPNGPFPYPPSNAELEEMRAYTTWKSAMIAQAPHAPPPTYQDFEAYKEIIAARNGGEYSTYICIVLHAHRNFKATIGITTNLAPANAPQIDGSLDLQEKIRNLEKQLKEAKGKDVQPKTMLTGILAMRKTT